MVGNSYILSVTTYRHLSLQWVGAVKMPPSFSPSQWKHMDEMEEVIEHTFPLMIIPMQEYSSGALLLVLLYSNIIEVRQNTQKKMNENKRSSTKLTLHSSRMTSFQMCSS